MSQGQQSGFATTEYPPAPPHHFVDRERLSPAANALIEGSITSVALWSAAGTGKTTLLAEWARRLGAAGHPVTWLTGDVLPEHPERLGRTDAAGPVVIVDDLHLAPGARVADLFAWLRQSEGARLIVAGRFQPGPSLLHLAATGDLLELRTADLAFTIEECERLAALHGLSLETSVVAALRERTGGWATGLALAMPVLGSTLDPGAQVARFAHDDRAIADFLTSEVLDGLAAEQRELLIGCALDARMPAALLAGVTGRDDAWAALETLSHRLTLITVSDDAVVFHPVLLRFLQAEARHRDSAATAARHGIAAHWYAQRGDGFRAVQHATLSGSATVLKAFVHEFAVELILTGRSDTVQTAVDAMPAPERGLSGPVLLLLAELPFGDRYRCTRLFVQADTAAAAETTTEAAGLFWRTLLAALHVLASPTRADAELPLAHLDCLTGIAADELCLGVDLVCATALGWASQLAGEHRAAIDRFHDVTESAHRAGFDWLALQVAEFAVTSAVACGAWEEATGIEETMVGLTRRSSLPPLDRARAAGTIVTAAMQYQKCLPMVSTDLKRLVAAETVSGSSVLRIPAQTLLLLDALDALDADSNPRPVADELEDLLRAFGRRYARLVAASLLRLVSIRLDLDGRSAARELVDFAAPVLGTDCLELHLSRYLLDQPAGGADSRERALLDALEGSRSSWHAGAVVGGWILLAESAQRAGREVEADRRIVTAVARARRFRTVRPFLARDAVGARLLATRAGRFGHLEPYAALVTERASAIRPLAVDSDSTESAAVVRLTSREHDILRELPHHQTLSAIARGQHLSPNTVKTHVRAIYQKLGVTERSEAVASAYRHGLL